MLACADIEEGIVLRQAGVRVPILVFGALSVSDLDGLRFLADADDLDARCRACGAGGDAAFNDDCLPPEDRHRHEPARVSSRQPASDASPNCWPARTCDSTPSTHISHLQTCRRVQCSPRSVNASTSPGRLSTRCVAMNPNPNPEPRSVPSRKQQRRRFVLSARLVRRGASRLLLYGIVPPPLASTIDLIPVMSLTSRVVAVKGLRPGEGVGYGWRYEASEPRTVAVVPAGYADGLDTRLCGRGHVLIRGRRVPIVGAVSMDMLTVDVTDLSE